MKLVKQLEKVLDFSLYSDIYVGFSGGSDSTALLLLLLELSGIYSFNLTAVHFEHGIRGKESKSDARWCKEFCAKRKIKYLEYFLDTLNNKKDSESIEEAARNLRLKKWQEIVTMANAAVALGHQAEDKIENFFLRLLRGSNASGLTKLRYLSKIENVTFLRPLLNITKEMLCSYLESLGISDWRKDSTNELNDYRRNFLRNKILKELFETIPEAKKAIITSYSALEDDARFLENEAKQIYYEARKKGYLSTYKDIMEMHPAIFVRVLRYYLTDELGYDFIPNKALIERINEEIKLSTALPEDGERKLISISSSIFICIHKGKLFLYTKNTNCNKTINWHWKTQKEITFLNYVFKAEILPKEQIHSIKNLPKSSVCFDLNRISETLSLRLWKNADRFKPFGFNSEIKVSKLFQNEKIPWEIRESLPMLISDNSIIWLPDIRRSSFAPVTKETTNVLMLKIEKVNFKYSNSEFRR